MYFADQALTTTTEQLIYQIVSIIIGVIFILHWFIIPFIKPDAVSLVDDIIEMVETNDTVIPETELRAMNDID